MSSRRLPKNLLSFKAFVLRGRVISQYREFMRALRQAPESTGDELRGQVRGAFRQHQHERDSATIKALLAEGKKQLVFAKSLAASSAYGSQAGISDDGSSWVGTGEHWDVRGRVGTQWPWGPGT